MDTIKFNKRNVLTVAHRGLSGIETENTCASFIAAGNRSYFGEECDIHVTADEKIVVIHDESTARVSDVDVNVERSSYEAVRAVRLRDFNREDSQSQLKRGDLIIPSLEEYVRICKKYGKVCVIELKNKFEPKHIAQVIEEIKALNYLENVIFISFSFDNMVNLRQLLPSQPLQFLTSAYSSEVLERLDKHSLDLDIHYRALSEEIINEVHAHGHKINCWTVDSKDDAEKLAVLGVDYITTNILE